MKLLHLITLSLFSTLASAQGPQIFQRDKPIILSVDRQAQTPTSKTIVKWSVDKPTLEFRALEDNSILHCWASPGQYAITATVTTITVDWETKIFDFTVRDTIIRIVVSGTTPSPDPDPIPPPDPIPGEDTSINPLGLTVLILKESETFDTPEKTLQVLNSTKIKAYLNSKAYKEQGGYVAWRSWDDDYSDQAFAGQATYWTTAYRKAIKDSQGKRPWLLISTPTKTLQFDISDKTEAEVLALLTQHGG